METLSRLRSGELAGISRLDLGGGLTEFPREIFSLADTLEILNLSGNRLSELPDDFARLHKLRILFCSDNSFDHLPSVLGGCPNLEMIGFKANQIATVDDASLPPSLRWLILTDNRISSLPASIGHCLRLQKLMLAGNRLSNLPDEMGACVNLELIRLAANDFSDFPDWLFELPRLSWLGLGGNPWSDRQCGADPAMVSIEWETLRISHVLGEGASGLIHQAHWHSEAGLQAVAVKVFKGEVTSDGLPASEMAACMVAGSHRNLIDVIGKISNHPDGKIGLVMSLIDPNFANLAGPPSFDSCTRDVYAKGKIFDLSTVSQMVCSLASVACQLHERGILHGDFYAHNVLWNGERDCLLGDFGAASFYRENTLLERIEVRAFGCLLEELLERCEATENDDGVQEYLWTLQRSCMAEVVSERPSFAEILRMLSNLGF